MKTYTAVVDFDPCYGFRVIKKGQTVTINHLIEDDFRIVACTNGDFFGGWGYRIYLTELNKYFIEAV